MKIFSITPQTFFVFEVCFLFRDEDRFFSWIRVSNHRWRTEESKTTIVLSVFMFQGTDVAQVFGLTFPHISKRSSWLLFFLNSELI